MRAVGGGAFGEEGDVPLGVEQRVDLRVDHPGVAAAAAQQEDRVGLRRQPADHRPLPDFGLGDEGERVRGVEREDVEPGDVVGDEQAARNSSRQLRVEANAEDGEQLPRPAPLERQPSADVDQWVDEADRRHPRKEVQREAQQAPGAQWQRCLFGSIHGGAGACSGRWPGARGWRGRLARAARASRARPQRDYTQPCRRPAHLPRK